MAYRLAWEEPRAVVDLVHVEKFFARNLGGLTRARTCAGPAREGKSRTPSMYADEKLDEAVVPRKRPNKGRQLPAGVVEGRASPKGVVRTLSRDTTSIRLAAVRRIAGGINPRATDVRPEGGARCVSSARRDLCGGAAGNSRPYRDLSIGRLGCVADCDTYPTIRPSCSSARSWRGVMEREGSHRRIAKWFSELDKA